QVCCYVCRSPFPLDSISVSAIDYACSTSAARSLWQSSIGTANSKTCRPYDAKRCTTTHIVTSNTRH
ncbi:unnamed protein product, partial [Musa hybrid cultivar]